LRDFLRGLLRPFFRRGDLSLAWAYELRFGLRRVSGGAQIWFRLGDFGEFRVIFGYLGDYWRFCGQSWGLLVIFLESPLEPFWRRG